MEAVGKEVLFLVRVLRRLVFGDPEWLVCK